MGCYVVCLLVGHHLAILFYPIKTCFCVEVAGRTIFGKEMIT